MSARTQLQSKPVADLREIAEGLGLEYKYIMRMSFRQIQFTNHFKQI